jgi:hypothetical protein
MGILIGVSCCELVSEKDDGTDNKEDLLTQSSSHFSFFFSRLSDMPNGGWLDENLFTCKLSNFVLDVELEIDFFIFDSFQGLPDLESADGNEVFTKGQFSSSLEKFTKNLKRENVNLSRFHIFPGYYDKTLQGLKLDDHQFAFVLIDCDLYSSTVPVLDFLTNKLVQGAIMAFDDWYCYDSPKKGERLAVSEWLTKNPNIELIEYNNFHWAGKSFIVNFR